MSAFVLDEKLRNFLEENGESQNPDGDIFLTDKYIKFLEVEYKFQEWNIQFVRILSQNFELEGKTVLEIGGSNIPRDIVINKFKVAKWVCVDTPYWDEHANPKQHGEIKQYDFSADFNEAFEKSDYFLFKGLSDDITPDFYDKFDYCFSLACLEHVQNLLHAFNIVHACLKSGGIFYAHWGPLWNSPYGSHFFCDTPGKWLTCLEPGFLPPFVHFLYTRKQIYEMLLLQYGEHPKLEQWASQISGDSSLINRYLYEDYEFFMEKSSFKKYVFHPFRFELDSQIKENLIQRLGDMYSSYDVGGAIVMATKTSQMIHAPNYKKLNEARYFAQTNHDDTQRVLDDVPLNVLFKKMIKRIIPARLWKYLKRCYFGAKKH